MRAQGVAHEFGLRSAFQNLLAETARARGWTFIPELSAASATQRTIRPDGTVRDELYLPRGDWQAKDPADDLDAEIGRELMDLHIGYEQAAPFPLDYLETKGLPLSFAVKGKLRLSRDRRQIQVNPLLTLAGIPEEVFEYRLGNRSALEWIVDQYQVYTDPKSGIVSDPNRPDDPEYITRLICQVVTVSLETLRLVGQLPSAFR